MYTFRFRGQLVNILSGFTKKEARFYEGIAKRLVKRQKIVSEN